MKLFNYKIELPLYGVFLIGICFAVFMAYNDHFTANKYYAVGYSIGSHNTSCYFDVWGNSPSKEWDMTCIDNLVVISKPSEVLYVDSMLLRKRIDNRIKIMAKVHPMDKPAYERLVVKDMGQMDTIRALIDSIERFREKTYY